MGHRLDLRIPPPDARPGELVALQAVLANVVGDYYQGGKETRMNDVKWHAELAAWERALRPRRPAPAQYSPHVRRMEERGLVNVSTILQKPDADRLDRVAAGNRSAWMKRAILAALDAEDGKEAS